MHSFLLVLSFPHVLPQVTVLNPSGFSTFHLCDFLFPINLVTWIWHMLYNLEISAHLLLPQIWPSSHQGIDVKCEDKGRIVKRSKCVEMKTTTSNTEIKLKTCNALTSYWLFREKKKKKRAFEIKSSFNIRILKSGILSYVWRIVNALKVRKSNPGNLTGLSYVRFRLHWE